jgi:NAD(P)-dependent dehydrogenase (short-subunit alcohol dehydrogenase family)
MIDEAAERDILMSQTFAGATIAVTGGGSGIGAAISEALARCGASVAVLDINLANARSVAQRIGGTAFEVDVTNEKQVSAAYASLDALHGSVNCAGFNHISPIVATTLEDWRKMTAVHLDGAFLNIRAAARRMISDSVAGAIVNIASINGFYGHRGMSGYASGKAGVTMLTRIAALELASTGIRVNAVAPGIVETELTRRVMADPDTARRWVSRIPLARLGQPDDIADIVVFLLGQGSRWITGQTLLADGKDGVGPVTPAADAPCPDRSPARRPRPARARARRARGDRARCARTTARPRSCSPG